MTDNIGFFIKPDLLFKFIYLLFFHFYKLIDLKKRKLTIRKEITLFMITTKIIFTFTIFMIHVVIIVI